MNDETNERHEFHESNQRRKEPGAGNHLQKGTKATEALTAKHAKYANRMAAKGAKPGATSVRRGAECVPHRPCHTRDGTTEELPGFAGGRVCSPKSPDSVRRAAERDTRAGCAPQK